VPNYFESVRFDSLRRGDGIRPWARLTDLTETKGCSNGEVSVGTFRKPFCMTNPGELLAILLSAFSNERRNREQSLLTRYNGGLFRDVFSRTTVKSKGKYGLSFALVVADWSRSGAGRGNVRLRPRR
jgi:hypothetical protein